jgi:HAD superfamily hydrolase (TIGR01509 family)
VNIVFDLGGVVVSWDPAALVSSVFDDPREQTLALEGVFTDPDWVELDRGSLPVEEAVARAARRTGIVPERLRDLFAAIPRSLVPIPSSVELIAELRRAGNRLLVLSNLHRASLAHLQKAYDLFGLFDGWVISCEVGSCKPEAAIYRRLIEEFALDVFATVFVDDMQENLDGAIATGMQAIKFTDAESCRLQLQALLEQGAGGSCVAAPVNATDYIGRTVEIRVDRPLGSVHPQHGFEYPVNYGFVPATCSPDDEELDAYVLGVPAPVASFTGRCIAVIHRLDDEDDKLIVVSDGCPVSDADIRRLTHFQERYFTSEILRR